MSPVVYVAAPVIAVVYLWAWALCRAAAAGDRRVDEEEEER